MSTVPDISTIIVSWNTRDLLLACVDSLTRMTQVSQEIIIVDNASRDGSAEAARAQYPQAHIIQNPANRGYAPANNQAIPLSRGRYLLLINADAEVLPNAVDRMVAFMESHPRCGVIGPRLLNTDGSLQPWTAGRFPSLWTACQHFFFLDRILPEGERSRGLYLRSDVREPREVDWVSSACFLIRDEALRQVGGLLDETYFAYMEDVALCERMKRAGWQVWYTPTADVIHHMGQSTKRQTGRVSPNAIRSFHLFFQRRWGNAATRVLKVIELLGYGMRMVIYGAGALALRHPRWREQAYVHYQYLRLVWGWPP